MNQITSHESRHIAREWASGQKKPDTDTLIIAMDRHCPPLTMMDTQGDPSGLLVEMWQLWSEKTRTPITFRPSSWEESVDAVKNAKADIHSGLFKNDERSQWMDFSIPIYRSETALYFKKSTPDFSLKDLADYRVGALAGSYQADYLTRYFPKINTVPQSDGEAMIFSLLKGDVAAILHETMTVEADLNRMGLSGRLKKGSQSVMNNAIHAGVAKQNKKMLDLINEGFAAIGQNKLAEIESRWIPRQENRFYSTKSQEVVLNEEEKLFLANHAPLTFSEVNWKPMSIVDGTNQFDGIIADYLDLITQRSGLRFKFYQSDTWEQVLKKYIDGDIDVVPALAKTDKIDRPILRSKPFVRFPLVIVTLDNATAPSDVSQLKNRKVAVGKGYTSYHYLKNNYPEIELIETDDVKSGLLLLANRRVSAFVGHMAVVTSCIQENGLTNLKIAGETDYIFEHCIGVDPQYTAAVSIINKVLDTMADQEHQKIYNRHISVHYEKGVDYSLILEVMAGTLFFGGFVLYWNRKLSREVTERKLTEQRLVENERKTRAMSEAIHDGLVMIDENAKVMYWNHAAENLFGIKAEDAMGRDMHGLIAPGQYIEKANEGLMRFAKTGRGAVVGKLQEITARHNDGTTFPVEVGVSSFQIGENWYAVGTIRDITDRLNARETVNAIRAELQQIFDNTHVGLFLLNSANQIQRCNERSAQILGYDSPVQMCGIDLAQIHLNCESHHVFIEKCHATLDKGEQVQMEYQLKKKDGTTVWCSLSGKSLDNGNPIDLNKGVIWAMDDITEEIKTRTALHENLKELERFYKMAINREEKMIDLKAEVNLLLKQTGQQEKYIVR
ncbi:transporter substrate-binding domain-containing protein [uncultured Desulfobacter sp.]|uniref:transporter substrate-binding domain-containing protein n=1 Tax=uncultured Desulfobacter sp. TaxID=240139 RepID=UPI002AABBA24|nr:transporter substrate-binding domain-containing protein [uncultured Desulfobacter sp.]